MQININVPESLPDYDAMENFLEVVPNRLE